MVEKIIERGIKSLTANSVVISRDAWLKVRTGLGVLIRFGSTSLSMHGHRHRSSPGAARSQARGNGFLADSKPQRGAWYQARAARHFARD